MNAFDPALQAPASKTDADLLVRKTKGKKQPTLFLIVNLQGQKELDVALLARVVSTLTKGAKKRSVVILINRGVKK